MWKKLRVEKMIAFFFLPRWNFHVAVSEDVGERVAGREGGRAHSRQMIWSEISGMVEPSDQ